MVIYDETGPFFSFGVSLKQKHILFFEMKPNFRETARQQRFTRHGTIKYRRVQDDVKIDCAWVIKSNLTSIRSQLQEMYINHCIEWARVISHKPPHDIFLFLIMIGQENLFAPNNLAKNMGWIPSQN